MCEREVLEVRAKSIVDLAVLLGLGGEGQEGRRQGRRLLPLFHSGWQSLMSRQVLAGFFLEPSGLRMLSIWLLRDLSVASTSTSCCRRLPAASSARI